MLLRQNTEAQGRFRVARFDRNSRLNDTRSAIQLITRAPAMPEGEDGRSMDLAEDVVLVEDPVSGITFEVAMYKQFRQMLYTVGLAWGCTAIKPNHIGILMG